jgi:DNA-binding MarR family transcriptional regulator/N-acetylglutamate synthase-like GNAT family acetyltransferase
MSDEIAAIRRFNRFYTGRLGLLRGGVHGSDLSLTEGRLVYELAQDTQDGQGITAAALAGGLGLDPGHLSRTLRRLERRGLIARSPAPGDGRKALLALTPAGRAAFDRIDASARAEVAAMLAPLPEPGRARVAAALAEAERLLGGPAPSVPYILRPPRPGDYGWVVHRQAALYAREYGWNSDFEALVAEIVATYIRNHDPAREACWIAERDGMSVGSVFLVRESDTLARLRLLYVEPEARGLGIGARLVETCLAHARALGYTRMTLWTHDILTAARRIYAAAGFRMVGTEAHHSFGHDLLSEFWERDLV